MSHPVPAAGFDTSGWQESGMGVSRNDISRLRRNTRHTPRPASRQPGGTAMKAKTRYLAALSAAAAVGAAMSLAPAALAATDSAGAPQPTPHVAVAANPTSPAPAPVQ